MLIKPRGTRDIYGKELEKINEIWIEIRKILISYGYSEIRTPTFENVGVFAPNNQELMLSNKEFFYLEDKEYILRPENTASVARAVVENKLIPRSSLPLRLFYFGSFFRHERPQAGRYREFLQIGVEKIKAESVYHDIENILLVERIKKKFGVPLKLKLNYLGTSKVKQAWNSKLTRYFEAFREELSEDSRKRIQKNPLRILDDKQDSKLSFVKKAPSIQEFLSDEDNRKIDEVKEKLKDLGIDFEWDLSLVRGIDYYTGLIYEWQYKDLTLIAGGRYDELFGRFSDSDFPSLGLAIGVERLKNAMDEEGYKWKKSNRKVVYLITLSAPSKELFLLVNELRNRGFTVVTNYDLNSLDDHFKVCKNVETLLFFGENEKKELSISIKKRGFRNTLPIHKIEEIIKNLI